MPYQEVPLPPGYQVIPLKKEDLGKMVMLDQQCFPPEQAYSYETMSFYFNQRKSRALGILYRKTLVAFILFWEQLIVTLDVDPCHRRKGLGSYLLAQALEGIKKHKQPYAYLQVDKDNEPAINLYKKMGFLITETYWEGDRWRHTMVYFYHPSKP